MPKPILEEVQKDYREALNIMEFGDNRFDCRSPPRELPIAIKQRGANGFLYEVKYTVTFLDNEPFWTFVSAEKI